MIKKQSDHCIDQLSQSDNRKKQQARADIQLKYRKDPESLFRYLSHPDWKVRYEIFKVLLGYGKKIIPVLVRNLRSRNDDVFYWVSRLVSHYKSIKISKVLVELVRDDEVSLNRKKLIVEALSHMNDEKSAAVLIELFESEYWVLRRQASDSLLKRVGNKTLDQLLAVDQSSSNAEYWAARTLMKFDRYHRKIGKYFTECLNSDNEEVIKLALGYFEEHKNKKVIEPMVSLLNHELWSIKRMTAEILCDYGKSAIPALEALIKVSTNKDEKYWISRILGEIPTGDRKLANIMAKLVTDSSPYIRSSAILNIGKSGIKSELYKIISYADDPNVEVRKNLAIALGEVPSEDQKILDTLKTLMDDPDEWVRHYANRSFERCEEG